MIFQKDMKESTVSRIGGKFGLLSSCIGLAIAQLIMTALISIDEGLIKAFFWFTAAEYKLNLFIGVILLLASGYFFGRIASKLILFRKYNYVIVGSITGISVLLTTASLSGLLGFFQEGLDNIGTKDNPFEDYILKPFFWVSIFGLIPALVMGALFGYKIKRFERKKFNPIEYHEGSI